MKSKLIMSVYLSTFFLASFFGANVENDANIFFLLIYIHLLFFYLCLVFFSASKVPHIFLDFPFISMLRTFTTFLPLWHTNFSLPSLLLLLSSPPLHPMPLLLLLLLFFLLLLLFLLTSILALVADSWHFPLFCHYYSKILLRPQVRLMTGNTKTCTPLTAHYAIHAASLLAVWSQWRVLCVRVACVMYLTMKWKEIIACVLDG